MTLAHFQIDGNVCSLIDEFNKYVCFSYSGAASWNSIPGDIRRSQNLRNFRISVNSANV